MRTPYTAKNLPTRAYILGYGSLMNNQSAQTLGKLTGKDFIVTLPGFRRSWNVSGMVNRYVMGEKQHGLEMKPLFYPAYCNVVQDRDEETTCKAIYVDDKETIQNFFYREGLYDIINISDLLPENLKEKVPCLLSIGKSFTTVESGDHPTMVFQSYINCCLEGAKTINAVDEIERHLKLDKCVISPFDEKVYP